MPLVLKPVGAPGAFGKVLAVTDAALDMPPAFTARTCNVYEVFAVKPVNV